MGGEGGSEVQGVGMRCRGERLKGVKVNQVETCEWVSITCGQKKIL